MTKHLRFLIVLLMTLVWSTGGAQTTIWSEDWTGGKANQTPSSFKPTIYTQSSNVSIQTGNLSAGGIVPELMIKSNSSWTVKITDLKGCKGDVTLTLKTNQIGRLTVSVGSSAINLTAVEGQTKTFSGTFNVNELAVPFNIVFKNKNNSQNLRIDDIILTGTSIEESKIDTKVSFDSNSGQTFTFTEGEYSDGTFTAPTATETTGVEGTIVYSSDNESAVKVNASTGALSFPGYGEATITATFTPTDAKKYAVSTDSYKVVNKADLGDFVFYESFDKCNGGEGWSENAAGKPWDDMVFDNIGWTKTGNAYLGAKCIRIGKNSSTVTTPVISFTSDAMLTFKSGAWKGDNTEITITVSDGTLIYGDNAPAKSVNIKLIDSAWDTYSMKISGTKSCKITFKNKTTSYRFFLDEVMVKEITTPTVENITLNESAANTLEAKTGVNVTLKRSMVENEWNTICLPFDVTAEQATAAFGEGVKIAQLDDKSTGKTLTFKTVDVIKATAPYLIKPTIAAPTEGYKFEGVTIKADDKGNVAPGAVMTEGLYGFVGVYNPVDATENIQSTVFNGDCYAAFLGANNTIFKAAGGTMKGFRAYFAIPNGTATSALRVNIDGTATSIKNIDSEVVESNAPVYNLQGQRVDGNNLTPGIYVKAGKKFVVK